MYRKSNARLLAISPIIPEQSRQTIEKHKLGFEILYDPNNEFARQLDLVHGFEPPLREVYLKFGIDLEVANGNPVWELPIPARLVISQNHTVKSIDINADYKLRPEPEATLNVLIESSK